MNANDKESNKYIEEINNLFQNLTSKNKNNFKEDQIKIDIEKNCYDLISKGSKLNESGNYEELISL